MKRAVLAFATLALAAGAQAATVTFQYGFDDELVNTPFIHTGPLGLFDSTLGTLTSASLLVRGRYQLSLGGTNASSDSQTVELLSQLGSTWDSSLNELDAFITEQVGWSYSTGTQTYAPGETKTFSFGPLSAGYLDNLESILHLLQAEGGGSFDMTCTTSSSTSTRDPASNFTVSQDAMASCGARVVYTYDAAPASVVPEPAALALVTLALGMVGVASRRRSP